MSYRLSKLLRHAWRNALVAGFALVAQAAVLLPAQAQPAEARAEAPAEAPAARPPFPRLELLERKSHGARAVELLGARLPEIAAHYRLSTEQLRERLLRDRRLKVDARGRLFYEEELEAPLRSFANAPGAANAGGLLDGTLAPLDQTFLLHSRPGAKRTVYLNFRGATLTNTAWNNGSTITARPFDLDGQPGTFSTPELQRIQYIWQRVAEDFAPFDVNVTTEAPASAAVLSRSGSGDDTFGTTALITSRSGVYNCSCGGVAYLGAFDDTSDFYKPALVFYDALGGGNEKYVAEAITHEVGHNLGLQHDGWSGGGYYTGHGSGATGWAPIMGVGYHRELVQWSKGEYSSATSAQDDIALIQNYGAPLRADDHGNTAATASALAATPAGATTGLSATGVIERASDVDVFSFSAAAGPVSFSLAGAARSSNLDALLELRNGAGTVLASANPLEALGATLSFTLPAGGTYYLAVRGTGKGTASTGYTTYGSLGQYAISGTVTSLAGQPPVAQASATPASGTVPLVVSFSAAGSADPDGSIVAHDWDFGDGTSASGASASKTYNTAGSYTALLRVTDNSGLTASKSVAITVNPVVTITPMRVSNIAMGLTTPVNGRVRATAAVSIRDGNGNPVAGATVSGRWSGIVSATTSGATGSSGNLTFGSPNTKSSGTFTFTVTGVSLNGYQYQPASNAETSDSITR